MALVDGLIMTSKFRGCILGALLGDCLGSPYENDYKPSSVVVQNFFNTLEDPPKKGPLLQYTDDTAMTNCIAESLVAQGKLDVRDLAERFVKEYYNQQRRGYGANVVDVFVKLRMTKFKDPLGPAREQFGGMGSYGNGGAMRIAPVALFFRGQGTQTLSSMARKATEITHTHPNGINGAILQCLAIEQSLWLNPKQPMDTGEFLEELIAKMQLYEKADDVFLGVEDSQPLIRRLRYALDLLQKEKSGSKRINEEEDVVAKLGSGVSALTSIPTAIFCFLRAHQGHIPNIETSNPFRRTVQYAITLGGDTDTIASMAGALSGALLGYSPDYFNNNLMKKCEGMENALEVADKLYSKSSAGEQEQEG